MVPSRTLSTGASIPTVGLGTFGSDKYDAKTVSWALLEAADLGFRHFDCAEVYGNEKEIGDSLEYLLIHGMNREDLWITSKVWNNHHDNAVAACENSLRNLGLDYLDLYLIHWPFPNHH